MAEVATSIDQYDSDYKAEAKRWIVEVIIISVIGSLVNWILLFNGSAASLLLAFIVNIGLVVVGSFLLFRHIDTLIFERLSQFQDSSGGQETTKSGNDKKPRESNIIVQKRRETGLLTRLFIQPIKSASGFGYLIYISIFVIAAIFILSSLSRAVRFGDGSVISLLLIGVLVAPGIAIWYLYQGD